MFLKHELRRPSGRDQESRSCYIICLSSGADVLAKICEGVTGGKKKKLALLSVVEEMLKKIKNILKRMEVLLLASWCILLTL